MRVFAKAAVERVKFLELGEIEFFANLSPAPSREARRDFTKRIPVGFVFSNQWKLSTSISSLLAVSTWV